jgi:transcriptional regulator with GAF, ATPase, and Fis domain
VRVVVAEDQHLLRSGLVRLLEGAGFTVAAAVATGPELRAALSAPGRSIRPSDIEFLHANTMAPPVVGDHLPSLAEAERTHIVRVLEATDWNKKEAARVLAISRGTLYRKILEYQLEPEARPAGRRNRVAEV